MACMPLFKSKSKLTLEEKLLQSRMKSDEKLAKSHSKFIEIAKNTQSKIPVGRVNHEFDHAKQRLVEHRLWLDGEVTELAQKRNELATLTDISDMEKRIKEKELLKDEIRILKDENASSFIARSQAERAIRTDEITMHDANQKEIRAHNKRVLGEWLEEVRDIGNDFVEDQRRISERNRQRKD